MMRFQRIWCVRACERERVTSQRSVQCVRNSLNRGLCANTYEHHVSVTWLCSPLGLELMVKLRTLLAVFTFILKAEARDYGKGRYIYNVACGVWPITIHCASWPIRADCACRKEGLCRKQSVWEAGHRGPTIIYSIWKMCFLNIKACQHILLH